MVLSLNLEPRQHRPQIVVKETIGCKQEDRAADQCWGSIDLRLDAAVLMVSPCVLPSKSWVRPCLPAAATGQRVRRKPGVSHPTVNKSKPITLLAPIDDFYPKAE